MEHPAGESDDRALRVQFDRRRRLEFHSTNPIERLNKMGYPGQHGCGGFLITTAGR